MFPVAIEYAYIPEEMAGKLMKYDLEERSLFQILSEEYGRVPKREEQVVEIVYADEFEGGDGIVSKGVENTIHNVSRLGKIGMKETDKEIIRIMTDC